MTRTNFSVLDSQKDSDFALPYDERRQVVKIPFRDITTIGPAGPSTPASTNGRWVTVHLNGGKFDGKQVISPATVDDMHLPTCPTGGISTRPDITAPTTEWAGSPTTTAATAASNTAATSTASRPSCSFRPTTDWASSS